MKTKSILKLSINVIKTLASTLKYIVLGVLCIGTSTKNVSILESRKGHSLVREKIKKIADMGE